MEIIPPAMPEQSETGIWVLVALIFIGLALLAIYYSSYRKRPVQCARRAYRKLVRHSSRMSSHQRGESLMKILRLALNRHNLKVSDFASYDMPISRHEFQTILEFCSCVRFSGHTQSLPEFQQVLQQVKRLLWVHR